MPRETGAGQGIMVGYHPGVSMSDYVRIKAAGSSALWFYGPEKTPRHLTHYLDQPREPTDAQSFGSLAHAAVLERASFESLYHPYPEVPESLAKQYKNPLATKAYAELLLEAKEKEAGKTFMKRETWDNLLALADSVFSMKAARLLLEAHGETELTGLFEHPRVPVRMRFRSDKIAMDYGADVSLKTTRDASYDGWEREVSKWGYHLGAALYLDGHQTLGRQMDQHVMICVESSPPWCCAVYRMREDALNDGSSILLARAERWRRYLDMNEKQRLQGYPDLVRPIGLTQWEVRRVDEEITEARDLDLEVGHE